MTFIDANIFMYAAGKKSFQKKPCEKLLQSLLKKKPFTNYCINTEILQEILHRYHSIKLPEIGKAILETIYSLNILIFPVEQEDLIRAEILLTEFDISTRDSIHLGMMQSRGINQVYTYDKNFSNVTWVKRLEPDLK